MTDLIKAAKLSRLVDDDEKGGIKVVDEFMKYFQDPYLGIGSLVLIFFVVIFVGGNGKTIHWLKEGVKERAKKSSPKKYPLAKSLKKF
jgi:hypothetical protein